MEVKMSTRGARPGRLGALTALAAAAALAVVGCGGAKLTPEIIYVTKPPATPSATPSVAVTPDASASGSATASASTPGTPAPTVSSTTVTQNAPDGRWSATFQKPVVGGVAAAAAMNNSIATKINAYISSFTGSGLPAVTPPDGKSTLEGSYSVAYVSPTLLSLRFSVNIYISGGAHPTTQIGSINFNVLTGAVIQLPDLFTSSAAALPVLTTRAKAQLTAALGADLFWPDTVTMADFGHAWVFTTAGLEVGWDQGEMAPMAAGPVSVVIPWPQLTTVIANPGPAAGFTAAP